MKMKSINLPKRTQHPPSPSGTPGRAKDTGSPLQHGSGSLWILSSSPSNTGPKNCHCLIVPAFSQKCSVRYIWDSSWSILHSAHSWGWSTLITGKGRPNNSESSDLRSQASNRKVQGFWSWRVLWPSRPVESTPMPWQRNDSPFWRSAGNDNGERQPGLYTTWGSDPQVHFCNSSNNPICWNQMGWAKFWFIVATCKQVGENMRGRLKLNCRQDRTTSNSTCSLVENQRHGVSTRWYTYRNEWKTENERNQTCYFKKWKKEKAPYPPIHLSPHTSRAASNDVPIQEGGDLGPILKCLSGSPYII